MKPVTQERVSDRWSVQHEPLQTSAMLKLVLQQFPGAEPAQLTLSLGTAVVFRGPGSGTCPSLYTDQGAGGRAPRGARERPALRTAGG